MKEDAGVGRLSDRLSEREFQLSRLQREIIQKKEVSRKTNTVYYYALTRIVFGYCRAQ